MHGERVVIAKANTASSTCVTTKVVALNTRSAWTTSPVVRARHVDASDSLVPLRPAVAALAFGWRLLARLAWMIVHSPLLWWPMCQLLQLLPQVRDDAPVLLDGLPLRSAVAARVLLLGRIDGVRL